MNAQSIKLTERYHLYVYNKYDEEPGVPLKTDLDDVIHIRHISLSLFRSFIINIIALNDQIMEEIICK